jgi:coenzyme F420-0:L-glutamate ligase/coenzyme F420-1:gamma-L-glutamate ligase
MPENSPGTIRLLPLSGIPAVQPSDDLTQLLLSAAEANSVELADSILVICQKIVSKAEGRMVSLADIEPSAQALQIAEEDDKDPRHVEVVLRESVRIVRRGHGVLICETRHGFVCANAGVDLSNAPGEGIAVLLPLDPDASATALCDRLKTHVGGPVGVIISDTFGRPWREGLVDVAIGCAGFAPIEDVRGRSDWTGRELQVTTTATADQLAAAAGILMVKDAGIPAVCVQGVAPRGDGCLRDLLRDPSSDLFR